MYSLRRALESDREWLLRLRREAYRELTLATFGNLDESRNQRHADECWAQGHIDIIQLEGEDVGMLQVSKTASGISLEELQIWPTHQRKGLGATILKDILSRASQNSQQVTLATGLKNDGAKRFYLRLGFRITGESETHTLMTFSPTDDGS